MSKKLRPGFVSVYCFACRRRFWKRQIYYDRAPLGWRDFCSNRCKGVGKRKGIQDMPAPAVPVLIKWLEERGLTLHKWSLDNGLDPSTMSKFVRGVQGLSLKNSLRVQEATGGAVTADMCVREEGAS